MRNICKIDLSTSTYQVFTCPESNINSLILEITPLSNQKTQYRVEVIKSGIAQSIASDVLPVNPNSNAIYYVVPYDYYKNAGTMSVRLLSKEGNSEYISFQVVSTLRNTDDMQVTYDGSKFVVSTAMSKEIILRTVGVGYDGSIYAFYNYPDLTDIEPTFSNITGSVTGFASSSGVDITIDDARTTNYNACFKFTGNAGQTVEDGRAYICMIRFTMHF